MYCLHGSHAQSDQPGQIYRTGHSHSKVDQSGSSLYSLVGVQMVRLMLGNPGVTLTYSSP